MKNKIRLIGVISFTVLIIFLIVACKSAEEKAQEDLQGTWKSESGVITFKDNEFEWEMSDTTLMKGTFVAVDDVITLVFTEPKDKKPDEYKYIISGDKLTIEYKGEDIIFTKQ
jgi:hypothetical protein